MRTVFRLLPAITVLLATSSIAQAATVSLAWDASPSPTFVGYRLDCGAAPGVYTTFIDVGNQLACSLLFADGQT
jgi:hypothetical protein